MEIISFNEAATANGRIEKFIENPDNNSGIVTVPKVIEAGESVTVPAGRVAVLPNVHVDGTLNVEGEVFIPSGSGLSTVVQKSGDTMTGNLAITTTSTTASIETSVNAGTTNSRLVTYPQAHASRANTTWLTTQSSSPLILGTSNVERMRIDTSGNIGIGTNSPTYKLDTLGQIKSGGIGQDGGYAFARSSDNVVAAAITLNSSTQILEYHNGLGSGVHSFKVNNTERFRIDSNGTALVTGAGGLGYGTGSGGTVTQLTSKSTTVTLNKPSGKITMNNAALAAGASVTFTLINNLLSTLGDNLLLTINDAISGCNYRADVAGMLSGIGAQIRVTNVSGSTLSESLSLDFAIIKGAVY